MQNKRVTVLGDGAWGTAIAQLLARNGHHVTLWCHSHNVAAEINTSRINSRFLPGITLLPHIVATTSLEQALTFSEYIFEAVPVKFLRSVIEQAQPFVNHDHHWIVLSKGIENNTHMLPVDIIRNALGYTPDTAILSGPSYAYDVANNEPTQVMLASSNLIHAETIQRLINNNSFHTILSSDPVGIQYAAAFKNVATLGMGLLEGASYGENSRTLAFMKFLDEMKTLLMHYGGSSETTYNCAGLGDLVLTAWGNKSKNRAWGIKIGQAIKNGLNAQDFLTSQENSTSQPEGLNTLISLQHMSIQDTIPLPLTHALYKVIFETTPLTTFVDALINLK